MAQPIITLYRGNEPSSVELTRTHYIFYYADDSLNKEQLLDFIQKTYAFRIIAIVTNRQKYNRGLTDIADNIIFCEEDKLESLLFLMNHSIDIHFDLESYEEHFKTSRYLDVVNFEGKITSIFELVEYLEREREKFLKQNQDFFPIQKCVVLVDYKGENSDDFTHYLNKFSKHHYKEYHSSYKYCMRMKSYTGELEKFSVNFLRFLSN